MIRDDCTPYPVSEREAEASMQLSLRWAAPCTAAQGDHPSPPAGTVQAVTLTGWREQSLQALTAMDFDGYALGGWSVGEPKEDVIRILDHVASRMPQDRPRYLMGVGTPDDIIDGVMRG